MPEKKLVVEPEKKKSNVPLWQILAGASLIGAAAYDYFPDNEFDLFNYNDTDIDKDGLSNHTEALWHLNPNNKDSDGDTISDGQEGIWVMNTASTGQQYSEWIPANMASVGSTKVIDALESNVAFKYWEGTPQIHSGVTEGKLAPIGGGMQPPVETQPQPQTQPQPEVQP